MSLLTRRLIIVAIFAIFVLLFGILIGVYIAQDDEFEDGSYFNDNDEVSVNSDDFLNFKIESINEESEWVTFCTTFGSFRYPYAFSDLIVVEAQGYNDYCELKFSFRNQNEIVSIYTMRFNSKVGSMCGTLTVPNSDLSVPVSVMFSELPKDFSEDEKRSFYATQETFNDVVFSWDENNNFEIAE